jgi:hypothetical protein
MRRISSWHGRSALIPVAPVALVVLIGCAQPSGGPSAQKTYSREATTADVERWVSELSNWGRWGKEDQIGTMNLITPATRLAAARLVREGVSVSLARDVEKIRAIDNPNNFEHKMLAHGHEDTAWFADSYSVAYHGYVHSHMDALCHLHFKDKMYNDFSKKEVDRTGARRLGIENLKTGIFARAILVDIPVLKGVKYLEPGQAIYPDDLLAWEKKAGVRIGKGDVVIVRTGRWARRDEKGPWSIDEVGAAGLHVSCMPLLKDRDIAILGSDAASDVMPSGIEGFSHPVHMLTLHAMGVHILDNLDLETISQEARKRGRWDFLLTTAPLAVPGGTGSPLNPIATF